MIYQGRTATKPVALPDSAAGVYLPEGRHPIIPIAERSGAKFFLSFLNK